MTKQAVQISSNCMTVEDLIAELQNLPQQAKVLFVCNYGDYHRTQQALPMQSIVEADTSKLSESAYSHSGIEFHDPDAEDAELGWRAIEADESSDGWVVANADGDIAQKDGEVAKFGAERDAERFADELNESEIGEPVVIIR